MCNKKKAKNPQPLTQMSASYITTMLASGDIGFLYWEIIFPFALECLERFLESPVIILLFIRHFLTNFNTCCLFLT